MPWVRHHRGMPDLVAPVLAPGSLAPRTQPVLTVDELVLRPWLDEDAPAVVAAYADPAVQQWHARSMTAAEAADWVSSWRARWSQESGAGWAVTEGTAVLRRVGLRDVRLGEGLAEIAYWVLPSARGRGVAPRALRAVSRWSLHDLGLHRLELAHGWHDMHLHALLAEDDC